MNSVLSPNLEGTVMTTASARHILVATEEECLALKDRINAGEEFGKIAMECSSCPSKAQGGDLGEFGPGMMVKEFDEAVFDGPVSVVQGPVKTQFGYHLLEVMSRG
jgi:peptidyl-prolyl cis-trans isomerase C